LLGAALGLGIVGLCVGSFITAVVARADAGFAGLLTGRSRCPHCGQELAPADLVPLLSWAALRGRCRHCRAGISPAYPLTELGAAAIGLLSGMLLALPSAVIAALLGWWLLAMALIDLASFRLPDATTLPLIPAGLLLAWRSAELGLLMPSPFEAALAAALGWAVLAGLRWFYARVRGREGLGLGDAKLCAGAGAWLGLTAMPWLLLTGALAGLLLALAVHRSLRGDLAIPFGPPLALAFWLLFVAAQLA
jgi:leader peptidase (prepilin peptidase)/N-methyltransferase